MDGCVYRWYHLMWFCDIEIAYREKVDLEVDLPDDVTASERNSEQMILYKAHMHFYSMPSLL